MASQLSENSSSESIIDFVPSLMSAVKTNDATELLRNIEKVRLGRTSEDNTGNGYTGESLEAAFEHITNSLKKGQWKSCYQSLVTLKVIRADNNHVKCQKKEGNIDTKKFGNGPGSSSYENEIQKIRTEFYSKIFAKEQWLFQVLTVLGGFLTSHHDRSASSQTKISSQSDSLDKLRESYADFIRMEFQRLPHTSERCFSIEDLRVFLVKEMLQTYKKLKKTDLGGFVLKNLIHPYVVLDQKRVADQKKLEKPQLQQQNNINNSTNTITATMASSNISSCDGPPNQSQYYQNLVGPNLYGALPSMIGLPFSVLWGEQLIGQSKNLEGETKLGYAVGYYWKSLLEQEVKQSQNEGQSQNHDVVNDTKDQEMTVADNDESGDSKVTKQVEGNKAKVDHKSIRRVLKLLQLFLTARLACGQVIKESFFETLKKITLLNTTTSESDSDTINSSVSQLESLFLPLSQSIAKGDFARFEDTIARNALTVTPQLVFCKLICYWKLAKRIHDLVKKDKDLVSMEQENQGRFTISNGKGLKLELFVRGFMLASENWDHENVNENENDISFSNQEPLSEPEVISIIAQLIHIRALKAYVNWTHQGLVFAPDGAFVRPTRWMKITSLEQ